MRHSMSVRCLLVAFACLGFVPFAARSRTLPPTTIQPSNATTDSGNSASSPLPGGGEYHSVTNDSSSSAINTRTRPAEGNSLHSTTAAHNSSGDRDSTASHGNASSSSRTQNPLVDSSSSSSSSSSSDGPPSQAQGMLLHLLKITLSERDYESLLAALVLGGFQWACVCLYLCLVLSMWWRMGWLC